MEPDEIRTLVFFDVYAVVLFAILLFSFRVRTFVSTVLWCAAATVVMFVPWMSDPIVGWLAAWGAVVGFVTAHMFIAPRLDRVLVRRFTRLEDERHS